MQAQRVACQEALAAQDALNASLGSMLEVQDDQYVRMLKGGGAEVEALLRALAQQSDEAKAVCSVQLQRMEDTFLEASLPRACCCSRAICASSIWQSCPLRMMHG